ncbi:MAG TPA: haloacid dehalogenase, partial [bacterium]|nr:haloacid dehalogenase [bacterium]
ALSLLKKTRKVLVGYPEISFAGFLHNAEKELVEAVVLLRYLSAREIPAPEEFGFDPISYLHGLAESTGELRRYLLDALRRQPDFDGEECLKVMDAIYFFLTNFTFPDALTRSLRRQVDYVRGILEKTRADVTLAVLRSERRKNG